MTSVLCDTLMVVPSPSRSHCPLSSMSSSLCPSLSTSLFVCHSLPAPGCVPVSASLCFACLLLLSVFAAEAYVAKLRHVGAHSQL